MRKKILFICGSLDQTTQNQISDELTDYDRADFDELNEILWNALKGTPMPAPVRSAVLEP